MDQYLTQMAEAGRTLPRTVLAELKAFLSCGDLSAGFARAECKACRKALLIPFSCKKRTCCPSCGAKRMAATGAHLVERVLPEVPIRHGVLSLPFDIRFYLVWCKKRPT